MDEDQAAGKNNPITTRRRKGNIYNRENSYLAHFDM